MGCLGFSGACSGFGLVLVDLLCGAGFAVLDCAVIAVGEVVDVDLVVVVGGVVGGCVGCA